MTKTSMRASEALTLIDMLEHDSHAFEQAAKSMKLQDRLTLICYLSAGEITPNWMTPVARLNLINSMTKIFKDSPAK